MTILCLLIAFAVEPSLGQKVPPEVREFLARSETERERVLAWTEKQLTYAKKAYNRAKRARVANRQQKAAKKKQLANDRQRMEDMKRRIKELKVNDPPFLGSFPNEMPKKGQIGRLRDKRLFVRQVIDGKTFIAMNSWCHSEHLVMRGSAPLYKTRFHDILLWVQGLPTEAMADSSKVEPQNVFRIVGTKSYQTVAGRQKTIWVIRPFSVTPYLTKPWSPRSPTSP
jgi:hypothetical protein